jgi:cyclic 2,3-diphosphoglycerate synthetase
MMRAVALIDGEHHAPVVRDALATLPYEVVAAVLVGGSEKLRGGEDYGVRLVDDLADVDADVVLDLSDEPVLDPPARFRLISRALALGRSYVGGDFRFDPPRYAPFDVPSLAVIGTGKRVGKTAVTAHVIRLLSRDRDVVAVAMGRGGPPEPELVDAAPSLAELLDRSRAGGHAASDYLELAALTGVRTVGCRRAGGGLAGAVVDSNVLAGARLARTLEPDLVVFDGSGASIPPVATDARILVVPAAHDLGQFLNPYRVQVSDLVVIIGRPAADAPLGAGDVPAVRVDLRLRPTAALEGRVAVFTTGAAPTEHLEADVVHVSRNLADRRALRAELEDVRADTFLVELKAAAIDVVAEAAADRDVRVVLADNEIVPLAGDLDAEVLALVPEAVAA